jgi:predicted AAA+ superfamily ATPase
VFERWFEIPLEKSCLIVGPRRSGKTTLLKHRYPELQYATLDDLDHLDWAMRDPKGFISSLGSQVIIDEIQLLSKPINFTITKAWPDMKLTWFLKWMILSMQSK